MIDQEILEFIRALNNHVPKEEAIARFRGFGEVALYANRQGYLRLGLEFLRCALEETWPDANLNYLFGSDSDFGIEHLTIDEAQFDLLLRG